MALDLAVLEELHGALLEAADEQHLAQHGLGIRVLDGRDIAFRWRPGLLLKPLRRTGDTHDNPPCMVCFVVAIVTTSAAGV